MFSSSAFTSGGVPSVIELAGRGQAAHNVGWILANIITDKKQLATALIEIARSDELSETCSAILSGALLKAAEDDDSVLHAVASALPLEEVAALLVLGPFGMQTWARVDERGAAVAERYWNEATPRWTHDNDELRRGVRCLMTTGRSRAAFGFAQMDLKKLPPRQL